MDIEVARSARRAGDVDYRGRRSPQARHRMFHKPVRVQRRRIDRDRVITNTKIALDALLNEWPREDCPARKRAIRGCLAVIQGDKPPSFARKAFIAAAERAGVLLEA